MLRLLLLSVFVLTTASVWSQKQGICGKVIWEEGNQMPGPDRKKSAPKAIAREILIYQPVSQDQARVVNGLFTDVQGQLVKKVTSEADGTFKVDLPAGEYSVFTKEPDGLFANLFDSKGRINVVRVEPKKYSEITIRVNYRAFY
jgi:hypothetical protein